MNNDDTARRERILAAIKKSGLLEPEVSGTPDLYRYYETGELPENEAEREVYKILTEQGLI